MMKDFFISYNSADRQWAEWIAWQLEEAGYKVDIQAWDSQSGKNFIEWMDKASKNTRQTIAVLSPSYLKGKFSMAEWTAAFYEEKLLPIRIQDFDVKGLFGPIVYIDLVGLDEDKAKEKLLKDVSLERKKPLAAPRFPDSIQHTITKPTRFPGALPQHWNVPHNRNPNFTGREELLIDLKSALVSEQSPFPILAIHGLGGIGKTQLVLEYIYRYADKYDIVWWIRAEFETTLANDYVDLARELDLPEKDVKEHRAVINAVRRWFNNNHGWLLVFDNAPSEDELRSYLPQASTGHVLITSRNTSWEELARTYQINEFEPQESIEFLCKRTSQTDEDGAKILAGELGHLPLALAQAAAYIKASRKTIADYIALFQQHKQKILERGKLAINYPHTVATTWDISFKQVKDQSIGAVDLLNLCAFLAPDDIPRDLLCESITKSSNTGIVSLADPLDFDDAIIILNRYSLINATSTSLSVHRLVQEVTRDRLMPDAKKKWADIAVRFINNIFISKNIDPWEVKSWPLCARLVPHALIASQYSDEQQVAIELSSLLNYSGAYLKSRANYKKAEPLYRRAIEVNEKYIEQNNFNATTYIHNLAMLLLAQGKYSEAEPLMLRALEIRKKICNPMDPNIAHLQSNMSLLLQAQGKYDEAESFARRALEIRERWYGTDHIWVARTLNVLGSLLIEKGNYAEANLLLIRALKIIERQKGLDHTSVSWTLNHLANLFKAQGKYDEAEFYFRRSLEIREKKFGTEHPDTAQSMYNLALLLQSIGRIEEAEPLLRRALSIREKLLGSDHPDTKATQENLDLLLNEINLLGDK